MTKETESFNELFELMQYDQNHIPDFISGKFKRHQIAWRNLQKTIQSLYELVSRHVLSDFFIEETIEEFDWLLTETMQHNSGEFNTLINDYSFALVKRYQQAAEELELYETAANFKKFFELYK